jgi:iron complex transport system ATP-binding protein
MEADELKRTSQMPSVLTARGVCFYRDDQQVLSNVTLDLHPGKITGVLGANGAGKSTLLSAIAGEIPLNKGSLKIDGQPIARMTMQMQSRLRAVLPQKSPLAFNLTVPDVLAMGAYPFPEVTPVELAPWIKAALEDCDVASLQNKRYLELSGGEQQRVQLARVLVQVRACASRAGHAYLLLDEPTAALDPKHQHAVMQKLLSCARKDHIGILIIMHDINLAARWCDRIALMKAGSIVAEGHPNDILNADRLHETYSLSMRGMPHPFHLNRMLVLTDA